MSVLREALRRAEARAPRSHAGESEAASEGAPNAGPAFTLEPMHEAALDTPERPPVPEPSAVPARMQDPDREAPIGWRPFHLVLALLALAAFGAGAYFWHELQPATPLPVRAAAPGGPAKSESAPVLMPSPGVDVASVRHKEGLVGTPSVERAPQVSKPEAPASAPPSPPATQGKEISASVSPASHRKARIHPRIDTAYAALQAGDLGSARAAYRQVLEEEPVNRDALLGMAAVDLYEARPVQAASHLETLRRADPRDPLALAGLIALAAEQADPVRAEARLKTLLASDPEAPSLQFVLGNQYARQGRWPEAQHAYLRASAGDPGNPDIAFNLAVSFDRVGQRATAREHYERALALAQERAASFEAQAALRRLQEINR